MGSGFKFPWFRPYLKEVMTDNPDPFGPYIVDLLNFLRGSLCLAIGESDPRFHCFDGVVKMGEWTKTGPFSHVENRRHKCPESEMQGAFFFWVEICSSFF